jgi:hypothetical protein
MYKSLIISFVLWKGKISDVGNPLCLYVYKILQDATWLENKGWEGYLCSKVCQNLQTGTRGKLWCCQIP